MKKTDQFQSELTAFERALMTTAQRIMRGLGVFRRAEFAIYDGALALEKRAFDRLLRNPSVHICICTHLAVQHRNEPHFNGFQCHECRVCGCKGFQSARNLFGSRGLVSTGEIFGP